MPMSRASLSFVPNRSIARLLQRRILGEDVDHPVADVEDWRAPRPAQRRQRLGDGKGDDGDDDPGVAGDGRRSDERGQQSTQAVHIPAFVAAADMDWLSLVSRTS